MRAVRAPWGQSPSMCRQATSGTPASSTTKHWEMDLSDLLTIARIVAGTATVLACICDCCIFNVIVNIIKDKLFTYQVCCC